MQRDLIKNKKVVLYVGFGALCVLALVLRYCFLRFRSTDYVLDLSPWYNFLKVHGFHSLKYNFSNYNLPYLYLLYIVSLVPLHQIVAIKGISIFFDLLMAFGVFLVVRHFHPKNYLPYLAAIITLFLPTVFINSSMWGQSDSVYTAFLVLSFFFLLKKNYLYMWLMWSVSFDLKLQAVFFLPLLVILGLRYKIWKQALIFFPVFIIQLLPALIAGRPLASTLKIYYSQVDFYHSLTMHAPNFYQWIPNTLFKYFSPAGIILTLALVLTIAMLAFYFQMFEARQLLLIATLLLLVIPFFLPQMHERYFYPAEIFCLMSAFIYRPAMWYVPLTQFVTLCAYTPFLFSVKPVLPLGIVAIFLLVLISHLVYQLFISKNVVRKPLKLEQVFGK